MLKSFWLVVEDSPLPLFLISGYCVNTARIVVECQSGGRISATAVIVCEPVLIFMMGFAAEKKAGADFPTVFYGECGAPGEVVGVVEAFCDVGWEVAGHLGNVACGDAGDAAFVGVAQVGIG